MQKKNRNRERQEAKGQDHNRIPAFFLLIRELQHGCGGFFLRLSIVLVNFSFIIIVFAKLNQKFTNNKQKER